MSGYFDTCPHCIAGVEHPPVRVLPRATSPYIKRSLTMLNRAQEDLRVECLRLASGFHEAPSETVKRAQAYFDFLTGKSDQTPRQAINAALDKLDVKGA